MENDPFFYLGLRPELHFIFLDISYTARIPFFLIIVEGEK